MLKAQILEYRIKKKATEDQSCIADFATIYFMIEANTLFSGFWPLRPFHKILSFPKTVQKF